MSSYVDKVLNQVKTKSKEDAADSGIEYSYLLPWYPTKNNDGEFETRIPEDVCEAVVGICVFSHQQ